MESVTVEVRCSKTGRVMRVGFVRPSAEYIFSIEAIVPGSGVSANIGQTELPDGRGEKRSKVIYVDNAPRADADEFNWLTFQCIHCDRPWEVTPILECGACDTLICTGTLRREGRDRVSYSCAICGVKTRGRLGGDIESYRARPGKAAPPALPTGRSGLLGRARNLLPGGKDDA
jgi:hypothetical protein